MAKSDIENTPDSNAIAEPWCGICRTSHDPLTGCQGEVGSVGMPGVRGPNADGTPGETDEEHMQRCCDAIAHNERFYANLKPKDQSLATAGAALPKPQTTLAHHATHTGARNHQSPDRPGG
jgi:hypothetical protein